jgi:hypothetical protein
MTLLEQVFAQAAVLAGGVEQSQEQLLQALCRAAVSSLSARLRPNLSPEDCKADFIAAASLYALAAWSEVDEVQGLERMQIGDISMVRRSKSPAAACLRSQAGLIMSPYTVDCFSFRGV